MIPATLVTSYIILGLALIGSHIENPFGDDVNDLPLEKFCDDIAHDIDVISSLPASNSEDWMNRVANRPLWPLSLITHRRRSEVGGRLSQRLGHQGVCRDASQGLSSCMLCWFRFRSIQDGYRLRGLRSSLCHSESAGERRRKAWRKFWGRNLRRLWFRRVNIFSESCGLNGISGLFIKVNKAPYALAGFICCCGRQASRKLNIQMLVAFWQSLNLDDHVMIYMRSRTGTSETWRILQQFHQLQYLITFWVGVAINGILLPCRIHGIPEHASQQANIFQDLYHLEDEELNRMDEDSTNRELWRRVW